VFSPLPYPQNKLNRAQKDKVRRFAAVADAR